jgi:hypothetical protein
MLRFVIFVRSPLTILPQAIRSKVYGAMAQLRHQLSGESQGDAAYHDWVRRCFWKAVNNVSQSQVNYPTM